MIRVGSIIRHKWVESTAPNVVGPELDPNCFQTRSYYSLEMRPKYKIVKTHFKHDKMSGLIWIKAVFKGYQQTNSLRAPIDNISATRIEKWFAPDQTYPSECRYQQMNVVRLKPLGSKAGQTILIKIRPYNIDKDQALQYRLRSGPAIWIKIRPYNSD